MTGTTARKLTTYLRKQKCGVIKVHTKYDKDLQMWSVIIYSGYTGAIYQFFSVTRDTVRAMRALCRSILNW